jgi:hypothetical protein
VLLTWATTVAGEIADDEEGIEGSSALWGELVGQWGRGMPPLIDLA